MRDKKASRRSTKTTSTATNDEEDEDEDEEKREKEIIRNSFPYPIHFNLSLIQKCNENEYIVVLCVIFIVNIILSSRYADLTVLYNNNNNNDDDEEEKEERMASVLYGARIPFKTPFFLFPFSYINSQFSFTFLILTFIHTYR